MCPLINMAAFKGADGKLWCELLSSDKNRDSANHKENTRSLHLFIQSPCCSSPCQNGGTCISSFKYNSCDCLCEQSFAGEYCKK
ncbi:unnamed protein product, partial [Pocillopora meandrina]